MNPKSSHRARTAETSHRLLEGRSAAWWAAGVGLVAAGVGTALFNKSRAKDAEAANRPVGKFIEIDGTRLHYVEKGSGSPIILLHGNGTMIQDWLASGVFDSLARSNRVIAIDGRGLAIAIEGEPSCGHQPSRLALLPLRCRPWA